MGDVYWLDDMYKMAFRSALATMRHYEQIDPMLTDLQLIELIANLLISHKVITNKHSFMQALEFEKITS